MNNYANWELTQLLPEINPYLPRIEHCEKQFNHWENKEKLLLPYWNDRGYIDCGIVQYKGEISSYYQHSSKYRDVWSFEDIRLYLESKGYFISIDILYFNINHYYVDIYEQNKVFSDSSTWLHSKRLEVYDSYEQAREEAIKYCLTKIKNG